MIEVINLSKRYGQFQAVDNLSFVVEEGKTLALVGTSGCGKTTTLKMINRLIEPSAGSVLINGKNTLGSDPVKMRREIGYIIQSIGLFPHYTIEENIAVVPNLLGWEPAKIKKKIWQLMERLKLPPADYAHKYPRYLSGGQQQRVGIARALAADPPIILMDEPFGALDPITRTDIRQDFMEMEELASKTKILVTHDIEEAFAMADLICLLDKGKIQQLGSPKALLFRPANDFVKQFLSDKLLQLEFHSICVKDVFAELQILDPGKREAVELKSNWTIFEAMSAFTRQAYDNLLAVTHCQGQTKYYELGELITAFHRNISRIKE